MSDNDTILVNTADATVTRRRGPKELKVDVLAENVNLFLAQVDGMLSKAPEEVAGKFRLTEFTVSAEISAKGSLVLLGSGGELAGKGGLTFKFVRSPAASGGGKSKADMTAKEGN